jgi:hypothetical protein
MRTPDEIAALYKERKNAMSTIQDRMARVRDAYNGDVKVVLPEIEGMTAPAVPNLLAQGVDQLAGRIASTWPTIGVTPPTQSRSAERKARTAERALNGWWGANRLNLKNKQRARHLVAYGLAVTVLDWDHHRKIPVWKVREPIGAYPDPDIDPADPRPRDLVCSYKRTAGWLRSKGWGAQVQALGNSWNDIPDSEPITLLEHRDHDSTSLIVTAGHTKGTRAALLDGYRHDLGTPTASISQRIGLNQLAGQFDQMLSMYETQARLMALEVIAVEKGIFPDVYLESRSGEIARFVDGPHDGRTGMVNITAGGQIRVVDVNPGYQTNPIIDRLERNQRVTGRLPAEFGGESQSNVRTGRRGDAILSAAIDMDVAEAQDLIATALEAENATAIALAKRFGKGETFTLHTGTGSAKRPVTFTPDVFTTTDTSVTYPASGSDMNSLLVGIGQRVGLGYMSKRTAASMDPYIEDAEREHDTVIAEGLEQALLAGIQQQASSGQIPPLALARIMELVAGDRMELAAAIAKVTQEAMEAEQAAQEAAQAEAGGAMDPAMMAAQAAAGPAAAAMTGNPDPMASVGKPPEGVKNLASLLGQLRLPVMAVKPTIGQPGRV